jgi:hypothetical protein
VGILRNINYNIKSDIPVVSMHNRKIKMKGESSNRIKCLEIIGPYIPNKGDALMVLAIEARLAGR